MNKCKYCGSKNLYLENKSNKNIMELPQVALKCADCGKWLKWCPKDERKLYLNENKQKAMLENWIKLKTELEMAIISLMTLKDRRSKIIIEAYHNVQQVMKLIEEKG